MKEVKLDLFKLYNENEKIKGSIKIILTEKLKKLIKEIINELKSKEKLRTYELSEKLGMKCSTLRMSFKRNRLSLNFVKKLLDHSDEKSVLIKEIKELSSGTGNTYIRVKSPKILTENLCKIVGAIVADGNLYLGKNNRKWQIKIGDQYRDNLELFSEWMDKEFGIKLEVRKDRKLRMFFIDFSNKIIFDYLNKLFSIKIGNKSSSVEMPKIINRSSLKYRVAFATGLSMFDGGIGFGRRNFSFNTRSKMLSENFNKVLHNLSINYSYSTKPNKANNLYQTFVWSERDLRKVLEYLIEPNTIKWKQLNILLNGSDKKIEPELIEELYPLQRRTAIGFLNIINLFKDNTSLTKKEIQSKLKRSERTTRSLLNSLERMKVLKSDFNKSYKVWSLNQNLKTIDGGDKL